MKKKLLGSLAVLAIAAMAAFNVNVNSKENGLSDVSLENAEALASESPTYDCPGGWDICVRINNTWYFKNKK